MPLYVYACDRCEVEVEELRPLNRADELVACPICKWPCAREVSAPALLGSRDAGPPRAALDAGAAHAAGCPCCP
ncbi:MAG: FmdB family zinc ribbon protein [Vicinamibacteria bacterium]